MNIRHLLLTSLLFLSAGRLAADSATSLLLPKPQQLSETDVSFSLERDVSISDPTASTLLASLFNTKATASAQVQVSLVSASTLGTFDYELAGFPNEGYKLSIGANTITIQAVSATGVIRAAQTLRQLAEASGGKAIPGAEVTDWPAFKLRGYMHDVGRSFISFDELKKEIDLLSRFKVNVFHWHMTDNQGFRFESKRYPQLNQASAMTRFAGSFYTQAQCTELEAYAAERGVIVIPEIDMPGHSKAFQAAMGFAMNSDQGRPVLKELLDELAAAFPLTPYIHLGCDEAGTTADFVNEMSKYVKETLGRKCLVWNPISGVSISRSNLPYIDMTEMWSTSGRKIDGLPNIDCRYNYVNHFDVFADLVGIYKSNIYYTDKGNAEVAGAITALWNDRLTPGETDIIAQNNLYANALATAERGWMGGGREYIETGGTRLPSSGKEYEEFADWERRFLYYKSTWLKDEPIPYVKQTNVRWRITDAFPNGGVASTVFPPETCTDEVLPESFSYNDATYGSSIATGAGIYLRHTWGTTVPAFFASPQTGTTAYAWTYVYSPSAQTAGALIEFHNYGRSENDKAPDNGNWDRKGSRIWVNGTEVAPPTWSNAGKSIGSEVALGNENFPARKPITIQLKAGWNKVLLKLPYVSANGIRLNKWMFTFVLTDPTGTNALDDVVYSPSQSLDPAADIPAEYSADPLEELTGYDILMAGQAANSLKTGQWYVMFDRGANHGYLYENASNHGVYNTATKPSGLATVACRYLVRLQDAGGGKYYLQTGFGNYLGAITNKTALRTEPTASEAITIGKIASTDGHFYLQSANGVVLDANSLELGDATVVGWGSAIPTATGGNNDWAFYPVTLVEHKESSRVVDQTPLSALPPAGEGWYVIRIKKHNTFAGHYLFPATQEINYNGTLYPLNFYTSPLHEPEVNEVTYYFRIVRSGNTYYWQMPNGRYLYASSNKFPLSTATQTAITLTYNSSNGFQISSGRYAVPYLLGGKYFIGETATAGTTYYDLYPIDLTAAGVTAWKVCIEGGSESTELTCTRNDVLGLATVYNGGYIFLPAGVTPSTSDFSMEGIKSCAIDAEAHTITPQYDPTIAFTANSIQVVQGWQTAGRGDEVMLLGITATAMRDATNISVAIDLEDGAEAQLSKLTLYKASSASTEIYSTGTGAPVKTKVSEATVSSSKATLSIGNLTAGTHYFWLGATVGNDATLGSIIDAAINSITYTCGGKQTTLSLASTGNPTDRGAMIFNVRTYPFLPRDNGSRVYRIPAMVVADDGSIVVAADKRYESYTDIGGGHVIDIVVRRSTDGGRTWSDPKTVAKGKGSSVNSQCGYGDPSLVKGKDGRLYCLFAAGNIGYFYGLNRIAMTTSDDNGQTWTAVTDLYETGRIDDATPYGLYDYFVTSGRGLYTSDGILMYLIPAQAYTAADKSTHQSSSDDYIFYSTDNGATWHFSPTPMVVGGDEAKVIQMNDGSLLGSIRKASSRRFNTGSYTRNDDGTLSFQWGTQWDNSQLSQTHQNNQDILYYQRSTQTGKKDIIIHSITTGQHNNLKLFYSTDKGRNWTEFINVQTKGTRYVTMERSTEGSLYLLFEDQSLNAAGGYTDYNHYPINFLEITRQQLEALIPAINEVPSLYDDVYIVKGNTTETTLGSWDSSKSTWTSNGTANPVAGVTLTKSAGTFNKYTNWNGHFNLAYQVGAANRNETLTLTAPEGYLISSISLLARKTADGTYTLTASNGTSIAPTKDAYTELKASDINAATTAITVRCSATGQYLAIADFCVQLVEKGMVVGVDAPAAGVQPHNESAPLFDLSGRCISKPAPGVYIKNGKKFIKTTK